jgi:5-methyltetrahydrofolate--homocysteine methyltransferase
MERQGFRMPLLIGGATTSRAHTAIKIAPHYSQPVVHVLDASRAVPVAASLLSAESRAGFVARHQAEYEALRRAHQVHAQVLLPLEEARARRTPIVWRSEDLAVPGFTGVRVLEDFPLGRLREFIDWSPFFHAWGLKGVYPRILDDSAQGVEAGQLFAEANRLLDRLVEEKPIRACGVYGLFPAGAVGDDVELYADPGRTEPLETLHFLRQQSDRGPAEPCRSLADFIAPRETGLADTIGCFAVTSGLGLRELCERFRAGHDDYNAILAEALADRLAEAFAECLHRQVRREWGYGAGENLSPAELIQEKYRGIRPAPGYPACPDHTEKAAIWRLLDAEARTGIRLTESYAMWPGSSVCGVYFAHPESRFFSLGRFGRDQVEDYSRRKGMSVAEVERWLAPNLNYERAES